MSLRLRSFIIKMAVEKGQNRFLLPCCVEAPPSYLPKAQHSLRMLLFPLGIDPVWVERPALQAPGVYYGRAYTGLPEGVLCFSLRDQTLAYFEEETPYPAAQVHWVPWEGARWPVLFVGAQGQEDWIASAFFWLSGWQEYVVRERDEHGRFPHHASLQAAWGTTTRPAVDMYREQVSQALVERGVPLLRHRWGTKAWALCPTHDIDYLRKWRPGMIYREVVLYFLLNHRDTSIGGRFRRLGRFLRQWMQPGDVYRSAFERMQQAVEACGGTATYFLKTGAHGQHDVYYAPTNRYLRGRMAALTRAGFELGLHPSYYAHTHATYFHEEQARLVACIEQPLHTVRQHYLRYEVPQTPRLHEKAGFVLDSSLGFGTHEGFRHATCLPFQLYDPYANRPLDVWEMPLSVMEATLFNRRMLGPEEARQATDDVMKMCRRFGGVAVMLWHNILWDDLDHPGWGQHFLDTLSWAAEQEAHIASLHEAWQAWRGGAGKPWSMS